MHRIAIAAIAVHPVDAHELVGAGGFRDVRPSLCRHEYSANIFDDLGWVLCVIIVFIAYGIKITFTNITVQYRWIQGNFRELKGRGMEFKRFSGVQSMH